MRTLALAVIVALAAGCQPPAEAKADTKTPEPPVTQPDPKPADPTPTEPQTQTHPKGFNESRLYQLADLEVVEIEVNGKKIKCWVMDEEGKRQEGMMFLKSAEAPKDHGMLFVFSKDEPRSFWMRNTLIDLDLAYISSKGKTVSVHRLKNLDETGVPSKGPAMYVLEMPAGGFAPFKIVQGSQFKIPATVKSKDAG